MSILSYALVLCGTAALTANATTTVVTVTPDVVATVDARFASVTHDIQDFIGFNIAPWDFDWLQSAPLRSLVGALAPLAVRCGGTWEDGIFWQEGPQTGRFSGIPRSMAAHNLSAATWEPFARFMNSLPGVDLVVGLGALWRHWGSCDVSPSAVCPGDIPWDSRNARAFLEHNRATGLRVYGYELGNEPAVWNYTWKSPIVTPEQHAADYAALRDVLHDVYSNGNGSSNNHGPIPQVVGPDTTWGPVGDEQPGGGRSPPPGRGGPNADYWGASLRAGADVDIAAFHYYAIQPGIVQDWETFVRIAKNGSMCSAVAAHARDLAASPLAGRAQLWLGEGGASYGGFGHDVKGVDWLRLYGGALSYIEDLGCASANGARVFMRQQLSNFIAGERKRGSVQAGGSTVWSYTPLPAYWVARLWKQLAGTQVLRASTSGGRGDVHAYALRAAPTATLAAVHSSLANATLEEQTANRTVVALVNWNTDEARSSVAVIDGCAGGGTADVYVLTPAGAIDAADDDAAGAPSLLVKSRGIALNGRELLVDADGNVPHGLLEPESVKCAGGAVRVELAGLTAAFVVV